MQQKGINKTLLCAAIGRLDTNSNFSGTWGESFFGWPQICSSWCWRKGFWNRTSCYLSVQLVTNVSRLMLRWVRPAFLRAGKRRARVTPFVVIPIVWKQSCEFVFLYLCNCICEPASHAIGCHANSLEALFFNISRRKRKRDISMSRFLG